MNIKERKRSNRLFVVSHKGNTAQQEVSSCGAFCSVLPVRARNTVLTLMIMAMAFVASPFVTVSGAAHAYMSEDKTTAVVADFDELKKAVEGSDGYSTVKEIVIDPQAAVDFSDTADEDAQVDYGDGAFYIPIEQPIRVSRDVTITSAEDVQVVFARSAKGGDREYDSKAFSGANMSWPGFFNIISSRGSLTIEGNITMSGDVVSAAFDAGSEDEDPSFIYNVEQKRWSRGNGTGIVDGGFFIHNASGGEVVINGASASDDEDADNVVFTDFLTDDTVINAAPLYVGGGSKLTMNGGSIVGNEVGFSDNTEANTAGAIIANDDKTSVKLNDGEIKENKAYVGDILSDSDANVNVGGDFVIEDNESSKKEQAASKGEDRAAAPEETATAAPTPKRTLMKSPAAAPLRNGSGATNQTPNDPAGTRTVATSRQLKAALNDASVHTIIVDETGALKEVSNKDSSGVTNPQAPTVESGQFYLPVDEPLTVASGRTVKIKTKSDSKQVIIARSEKFTANHPGSAIFNVANGGSLELAKGIVMTGEQVTSVYKYSNSTDSGYDPGQGHEEPIDSGVLQLESNEYFGARGEPGNKYLTLVSSGAKQLALEGGYLVVIDDEDTPENPKSKRISFNDFRLIEGAGNKTDYRLIALKDDGTPEDSYATSLTRGKTYVMAWTTNRDGGNNTTYYATNNGGTLGYSDNINNAIVLTAKSTEDDDVSQGQEYKNVKFKFNAQSPEWSQANAPSGTKDAPKGYFVQVQSGGKLKISGATLRNYKTKKTYTKNGEAANNSPVWSAPVVVQGNFEMTSGEIIGNRVGYCADDSKSNEDAQAIKSYLLNTELMNTAGGVIFKGSNASGTISGGQIRRNKGDAGGIIVTDNAKVTLSGSAEGNASNDAGINGNLGWHHAGAALVDQGGTLHMTGGEMRNNTTWNRGGAVWATEWGTNGLVRKGGGGVVLNPRVKGTDGNFVMDGGRLDNNMAFIRGGAINVESDGVQLNGGYITNNKCKSLGGAIYVEGDSADYTYTLVIKQGYIGSNNAVRGKNETLGKQIDSTKDDPNYIRKAGTQRDDWDRDFWGVHHGNGGGVWLCPMGGTSVLAYNGSDDYKVVIDENNAAASSDKSWYGHDFYICRGKGSALVQNLVGDWRKDNGSKEQIGEGTILNGMIGLYNHNTTTSSPGVQITGNLSRNGGGIAANGTVILGKPDNVHRYTAKLDITKRWEGIAPTDIKLTLYYKNGNVKKKISEETLVGSANTEYKEDDETVNLIIEGSPTNNNKTWHATVEIPAIYKDAEGNEYVLYDIEDPDNPGHAINLRTTAGVAKLYDAIHNGKEIKILNWYLELEEARGNYSTTNTFYGVIAKAEEIEPIDLKNPVTGESVPNGQFEIRFSTVTFGQTLTNSLKEVELTKVGVDQQPIENAVFELHPVGQGAGSNSDNIFVLKSKVDENNAENPGADDPLEVVTSDEHGKITLSKITIGKRYFLFETSIGSDGKHERAKSPWLIEVDNNGNTTTKKIKDEYYSKTHNAKAVNNGYMEETSTYADGEEIKTWVKNRRWKLSWFENTATAKTLENRLKPIELTKTDASGNVIKKAATFKIYKARDSVDSGKTNWVPTGNGTVAQVDPTTGKFKVENVKAGDVYMIFETSEPAGYVRAVDPWILEIDPNGNASVYVKHTDWLLWHWVRGGSDTKVDADYDHTARPFGQKEWPKNWFISNDGTNIKNKKANIKLTKVAQNGDTYGAAITNAAVFKLYEADKAPSAVASNENSFNNNVSIARKSNDPVQTQITQGGVLTFTNLDTEKLYLLFEASAPDGYKKSKAPWLVYVKNDGTYRLFKHNSTDVNATSWSTGAEGTNFAEIKGNNAGKLGNTPIDIWFIKGDIASNAEFTDVEFDLYRAKKEPTGNADHPNVYRIDTEKPNNGKIAHITKGNDNKYHLPVTAAAPGEGYAYYMLFETKAHDGYAKPRRPWGIVVDEYGDYVAYKFKDDAIEDFELMYAEEDDVTTYDVYCDWINTPITGAKLLNEREPIELTKVEGTISGNNVTLAANKKISGARFRVYHAQNVNYSDWVRGELISDKLVSDENGVIKLPRDLSISPNPTADYWLEEIDAAPGYAKSTRPWIINVNKGVLANVFWPKNDVVTEGNTVKVKSGPNNVQYMKPYVFNVPLKFKKVSASDSSRTLSNVSFTIYKTTWNDNGTDQNWLAQDDWSNWSGGRMIGKTGEALETVTSGTNGEFRFNINEAGGYFIFENTDIQGYKKATNPWLLVINEDGTYQLRHTTDTAAKHDDNYWYTKYYSKCEGLTLTNERKPIELYKVDEKKDSEGNIASDAAALGGAKFVLLEAEVDQNNYYKVKNTTEGDTVWSKAIKGTDNKPKEYVSDSEDGKIVIDDLNAGTYMLFETTAPVGFVRTTSPWIIVVEDDASGRRVTVKKIKNDFRNKADFGSNQVKEVSPDTTADQQIVHDRWWFKSVDDATGWFTTMTAPYKLDNSPKYLTKVDIDQVNSDDPRGLVGAKFELYSVKTGTGKDTGATFHRKDTLLATIPTDSLGRIELPSSATRNAGKYLLFEITPPSGYKQANKPWLLEIDANGNITVKCIEETVSDDDASDGSEEIEGVAWWRDNRFATKSWSDKYIVPNTPNEVVGYKKDGYTNVGLGGVRFKVYKATQVDHGYYKRFRVEQTSDNFVDYTSESDANNDGKFKLPWPLEYFTNKNYKTKKAYYALVEDPDSVPAGYAPKENPILLAVWYDSSGKGYYIRTWDLALVEGETDLYDTAKNVENNPEDQYCDDVIENYPTVSLTKIDMASAVVSESNGKMNLALNSHLDTLQGVQFKLYEANVSGSSWTKKGNALNVRGSQIITSGPGGIIDLGRLEAGGNYLLVEHAPKDNGYVKPNAMWRITIGSTDNNKGKITYLGVSKDDSGTNSSYLSVQPIEGKYYITNSKVYNLPSSGGIGTYWFMIIGAMMMAFAATMALTKGTALIPITLGRKH